MDSNTVLEENLRSPSTTEYKSARLDQSITMGHHKPAGRLSQDVPNQFLSGEENQMASYQRKVPLHWTPLSLLCKVLYFLLLSDATHPLHNKTSMSGEITHNFQERYWSWFYSLSNSEEFSYINIRKQFTMSLTD